MNVVQTCLYWRLVGQILLRSFWRYFRVDWTAGGRDTDDLSFGEF